MERKNKYGTDFGDGLEPEKENNEYHTLKKNNKKKWFLIIVGIIVIGLMVYGTASRFMAPNWEDFADEKNLTPEVYTERVLGAYQKRMAEYRESQTQTPNVTGTGVRYVIADRLCLRQEPNMNQKPLGEIVFNSQVVVQDTSNHDWYRISNPVKGLQERREKKKFNYYDAGGNLIVEADVSLTDKGDIYVAARYLRESKDRSNNQLPSNPKQPFCYGLQFYNKEIASMLAEEIWDKMGPMLQGMGYDGVKITASGSGSDKETEEKITKHILDGMQTSTACYKRMMNEKQDGHVFAMQTFKNDGEAHDYSGYIVARKDAGINTLEDLKKKKLTIFTGKDGSSSSYILQMRALERLGIKQENMNIKSGLYHLQLLTALAEGIPMDFSDPKHIHAAEGGDVADIAFVGDFVMQSSSFDEFATNKKFGLRVYNNQAELSAARKNIVILPIKMERIPEQPILLSEKLYNNMEFRDMFRRVLVNFYDKKSEKYGVVEATVDVYQNLPSELAK